MSELAAMSTHPKCLRFRPRPEFVDIALDPQCIAKNERDPHCLAPFRVPALKRGHSHHTLYPVASLQAYLYLLPSPSKHVWVDPRSGAKLHKSRIARILV